VEYNLHLKFGCFKTCRGLKTDLNDGKTGKSALDSIAEQNKINYNPLNDPAYKSDYDMFLESSESNEITSDNMIVPIKGKNND
jgi:hypothetical protein